MKRTVLRTLPLMWMALIFALSSIPASELPTGPDYVSTLVHVVLYFGLGVLMRTAWLCEPGGRSTALTTGLASLYGASDELHQIFVYGRSPDPIDWLVDTASALVGVLVAQHWLLPRVRKAELRRGRL